MIGCGSSSALLGTSISTVRLALPGAIPQLGERLLCKQEVAGSIPAGSIDKSAGNRHFLRRPAARCLTSGTKSLPPPTNEALTTAGLDHEECPAIGWRRPARGAQASKRVSAALS